MDKKVKSKLKDIAAELLVSPITAYVKVHEIRKEIVSNEAYVKAKDTAKTAGGEIKSAAKKVSESDAFKKGVQTVKDTAKKVSESDAYAKAKESAIRAGESIKISAGKAAGKAGESIKGAAAKIGINIGDSENEEMEEFIEDVDISDVITEEDASEDPAQI